MLQHLPGTRCIQGDQQAGHVIELAQGLISHHSSIHLSQRSTAQDTVLGYTAPESDMSRARRGMAQDIGTPPNSSVELLSCVGLPSCTGGVSHVITCTITYLSHGQVD